MRKITKNPRDVIPDITDNDCVNNIIIVVQKTRNNTYICMIEHVGRIFRSAVSCIDSELLWTNTVWNNMMGLIIIEYNLFEFEDSNIKSEIFVLENKNDINTFVTMFDITNNILLKKFSEKFQ